MFRILLFLAFAGACDSSKLSGRLMCSTQGTCPTGYVCVQSVCYLPGDVPDLSGFDLSTGPVDLGISAPLIYPSAPVFVSGGGGGSQSTSLNSLELSFGGSPATGACTAPSGATLQLSVFATDTIQ